MNLTFGSVDLLFVFLKSCHLRDYDYDCLYFRKIRHIQEK